MSFKSELKNAAALSKIGKSAWKTGRKRQIKDNYPMETEKAPAMRRGTPELGNGPDAEGRGTDDIRDVDTGGDSVDSLRKKMLKIKNSVK